MGTVVVKKEQVAGPHRAAVEQFANLAGSWLRE